MATTFSPIFNSGSKANAQVFQTTTVVQTTMTSATATAAKTATKRGRGGAKRKLALLDGTQVDLLGELPVTPQVVDALRRRVLELEDQIASGTAEPPAKRAKTENAEASGSAPTAASLKADEKKRKMQVKKIFDRLKKECKADGVKFQGSPKTIKFDEVFEVAEFEALFGGKGFLVQPRPDNKPKSTVTIITFNGAQAEDFFGGDTSALKGNVWTRGGGPSFSKSVKVGTCDVSIQSMDVNYSKNGMKCTLKFEVVGDGDHSYCSGGRGGWVFGGFY